MVGYKVYYGVVSRVYTNVVDVGNTTTATITGLVEGVTYYFAATAYNSVGLESTYSPEVSYTVPIGLANQPPTLNPIAAMAMNVNAGLQTVNLTGITSGGEAQTLVVTAVSSNTAVIPNPTVTYTSPNSTGTLTFTPVANATGSSLITVTVNDGGVTNNLVTQTFLVTVNPVNQPPTLNPISNVTVSENAGVQTVSLAGIGTGGEAQTLTVTAVSSNTAVVPNPTVTYTSPNATGTLTFTPVANTFGSSIVTVTVNDNGGSNNIVTRTFTVTVLPVNQPPTLNPISNVTVNENSGAQAVSLSGITSGGEAQTLTVTAVSSNTAVIPNPTITYTSPNATGTLNFTPATNASGSAVITVTVNDNGGSNNIVTRSFTITVLPVNQPPTLNPISNVTIAQNSGVQTVNLAGIGSGGEAQTLTVTAVSSNTAVVPNPTVTYTSPNATGTLTFTPVANVTGSSVITVTVNDNGGSNNIVTRSFTVTVLPVNQPPTLNPISSVTINENAGVQTVNLAGIGTGGEAQTLTVTAVSSNTAVVPNPTVTYTSPNATGTLTFTPVANAFGSSVITVTVNDNGGSNNIVTQSFTVTVLPVNQPPTLNPLSNLLINANSGQQTVNLSGIGSGGEVQTLTVTAVSSNTAVVPNPTVTYTSPNATGTLAFTPVLNAAGSSVITVTVNDNGSSNNIVTRAFTVTVNGLPSISAIAAQTIATNTNTGPIAFTIGDLETPASSLTLSAASSATGLIPVGNIVFGGSASNRTVTLTPVANQSGSATITLTVTDGNGASVSTQFQLTVLGPPQPPSGLSVTIVTNGMGSVTPNLKSLQITNGQTYTVTAVPAVSNMFAGWSGSIESADPVLTFVATSNLVFQANFVPTSFPKTAGKYSGLFYENDQVRLGRSGAFSVTVTPRGTYSGKVQSGANRYSFSGSFDSQARMSKLLTSKTGDSLNLDLRLGAGAGADKIFGSIANNGFQASMLGDRAVFNTKTQPAPFAGAYTVIVPGISNDPSFPTGTGFGSVRVTSSGKVRFTGMLADGTKVSQSASLSRNGEWPFYIPLYSGGGAALSWLTFASSTNSDVSGLLSWIKGPSFTGYYPNGFTNETEVIGSTYVKPVGNSVINLPNGRISFTGGNLANGFTNDVYVAYNNKVSNSSPNELTMTFSASTGIFKGKAARPDTGVPFPFSGVVLQKMNAGYGFLLGSDRSSEVVLEQ